MKVNGRKIKELRGDRPTEHLAIALDMKVRNLQRIESMDKVRMNLNNAKAAAKFLGVKLSDISAE